MENSWKDSPDLRRWHRCRVGATGVGVSHVVDSDPHGLDRVPGFLHQLLPVQRAPHLWRYCMQECGECQLIDLIFAVPGIYGHPVLLCLEVHLHHKHPLLVDSSGEHGDGVRHGAKMEPESVSITFSMTSLRRPASRGARAAISAANAT